MLKKINRYPTNRLMLNITFYLIVVTYLYSMFIYPLISTGFDWGRIQNIWDRWQGLNVGMLAFSSSVIAFSISKYNAESQRKREFLSARAFLPAALSELNDYFKNVAVYFNGLLKKTDVYGDTYVNIPKQPAGFKNVFENCIRHATPEIGDYLADILSKLQVIDARINPEKLTDKALISYQPIILPTNLIIYTFNLGELACMVNKAFSIGRGKELNLEYPDWEEFLSAYHQLKIYPEKFTYNEKYSLELITKQHIKKNK